MYEQNKICEACYFLSRLGPLSSHVKEFSFELSAFLSAARSVLQYAYKEAKTKPGGKSWYNGNIQNVPVIWYFKDKRDLSIHVKPVVPNLNIGVAPIMVQVSIHASVNLKVTDPDGNVIEERNITSPIPKPETPPSPSVTVSYHFGDWSGFEDIEALCHQYFAAIEALVKDGQAKSFLSV